MIIFCFPNVQIQNVADNIVVFTLINKHFSVWGFSHYYLLMGRAFNKLMTKGGKPKNAKRPYYDVLLQNLFRYTSGKYRIIKS